MLRGVKSALLFDREELTKCQENIQSLETEIQKIAKEIELQESKENK